MCAVFCYIGNEQLSHFVLMIGGGLCATALQNEEHVY